MCLAMGESRPDTKFRCGYRPFADGGFNLNCFNCNFRIIWRPGRTTLTNKIRQLLGQIGLQEQDVSRLNFTAWQIKNNMGPSLKEEKPPFIPQFDEIELPKGAKSIDFWLEEGLDDGDFLETLAYAATRGEDVLKTTELFWTPSTTNGMNRRLIVPFIWNDTVVGYSGRAIDKDVQPRYYTSTPAHFLINNEVLSKERKFVILVEGTFDAFAIDGVASQGAKLSDEQAHWLKWSGKEIIVLPDQEESGQPLIDAALKNGWKVSFPGWDSSVKDANDAVNTYGRLYAVKSVLDGATDQALKINLLRKKLNR